jgi:hypothetical protein
MRRIKTFFIVSGLFILTSIFSGCGTDFNIAEYINKNVPLKLTINKMDTSTGLTTSDHFELPINSEKYKKIIEWGNKNTDGWHSTPASYIADIYVGQGDFRMLYTLGSNGVIIGCTDKEGKPKQYSKIIEKGSLDFLYK